MLRIKPRTKRLLKLYDKGERNLAVIAKKMRMTENAVYLALRTHRRFSKLARNRELVASGAEWQD